MLLLYFSFTCFCIKCDTVLRGLDIEHRPTQVHHPLAHSITLLYSFWWHTHLSVGNRDLSRVNIPKSKYMYWMNKFMTVHCLLYFYLCKLSTVACLLPFHTMNSVFAARSFSLMSSSIMGLIWFYQLILLGIEHILLKFFTFEMVCFL